MKSVSISYDELSIPEIDFLLNLSQTTERNTARIQLNELVSDFQHLVQEVGHRDNVPHIEISTPADLDHFIKVHWALSIAKRFDTTFTDFEDFLKKDTRFLGLTLSDICDKYQSLETRCSHCAAGDSNGLVMNFNNLSSVQDEFFRLFHHAAIGRKGEPFLYNSEGKKINDVAQLLVDRGIRDMSFYFGIFNRDIPGYTQVTDSMISFKSVNQNVHISSGLTYHPFAPHKQLFEDGFKYALDSCFEFSDEITIELLGSDVTKQTSIEEVKKQFAGFETRLLADYDIGNEDDGLILKKGPRKVQLKYKEPNSKVYDQGLYKKTLESSGLLQKYSEVMGEKTYPPICTSTLNHNFIVVEPDGGIKTCVSFDGMHTQAQVNLFKDGYSGVLEWLENRFHQQRDEIINRLPDIVYRRHSMCDCR